MINLIILGDSGDSSLADTLYRTLKTKFKVAYIRSGYHTSVCGEPDFLLLECGQIHTGNGARSIIICKSDFSIPAGRCAVCEDGAFGVMQTENQNAAELLSGWGIPVISCGMSVTDTLTLSSVGAEGAVVCLQRSIPTLDGATVEPFEAPLNLPCDSYALLCVAAVLLLSGQAEVLRGLAP